MRSARVWKRLIGVDDRTVIGDIEFADDDDTVVVHVRPRRPKRRRCGRCERPAPGYDAGEGRTEPTTKDEERTSVAADINGQRQFETRLPTSRAQLPTRVPKLSPPTGATVSSMNRDRTHPHKTRLGPTNGSSTTDKPRT